MREIITKFIYTIMFSVILPYMSVMCLLCIGALVFGIVGGLWFNPFTCLYGIETPTFVQFCTIIFLFIGYIIAIMINMICLFSDDLDGFPLYDVLEDFINNISIGCKKEN